MKEIVLVCGAAWLSVLIAYVLEEGRNPKWVTEKHAYDREMSEIVSREPGGLLSDFEARW